MVSISWPEKRGLKVNSNFQGKMIRQTFISNCEK